MLITLDYKYTSIYSLYKNSILRYGDTKVTKGNRVYYSYYVRKELVSKDLTHFKKDLQPLNVFEVKSIDFYYQIFSTNYINNSAFYGLLNKFNCIIEIEDFSNLIERW